MVFFNGSLNKILMFLCHKNTDYYRKRQILCVFFNVKAFPVILPMHYEGRGLRQNSTSSERCILT